MPLGGNEYCVFRYTLRVHLEGYRTLTSDGWELIHGVGAEGVVGGTCQVHSYWTDTATILGGRDDEGNGLWLTLNKTLRYLTCA